MQTAGAAMGAQGRRRVTIADVAERLGVTKSTVSRALNGYPDIAEGTRIRIARTAERMGYRPLTHAQAIRTGRTRSLGLVLQIDGEDSARPFLAEFIAGLTRRHRMRTGQSQSQQSPQSQKCAQHFRVSSKSERLTVSFYRAP